MALLELRDLRTFFRSKRGTVKAVNGVSYSVDAGKVLGVVGESGSGKSVSAMSILRLLDNNGYIDGGEIYFEGRELTKLPMSEMYKIRGNEISVIFQEPMTSLNPVFTVERQLSEPLRIHQGMSKAEAKKQAVTLLSDVKIPNPEVVAKQYPHQLSGGMRQRVMIAMALACDPDILIADEPTTALDVTIQAQIVELMKEMQQKNGNAIIMITHDLGVVADVADKIMVMYAGSPVEMGTADEIFYQPHHPYTWGLMRSIPKPEGDEKHPLTPIEGNPPSLVNLPSGCSFAPRCPYATDKCRSTKPERVEVAPGHFARCHYAADEAFVATNAPESSRTKKGGEA